MQVKVLNLRRTVKPISDLLARLDRALLYKHTRC